MLETLMAFPPATLLAFLAGALVLNLTPGSDVLFALESKPPLRVALGAALQHMLAIVPRLEFVEMAEIARGRHVRRPATAASWRRRAAPP